MKTVNQLIILFLVCCLLFGMSGCDHDITMGSTVYEDGSIDRTIVLYEADSSDAFRNILDVNEARGWEVVVEPAWRTAEKKEKQNDITFKKHFASVTDANQEMNRDVDTLFHIRSTFEKKNRWFYTYMEYSDTYTSLDRFKAIPQKDYFTAEDYTFISRLPAEGKPIEKADSLYLARLNEKIYDVYGSRTIYEDLFNLTLETMGEYEVPSNWKDSLLNKKEHIYQKFVQDGGEKDGDLLSVADFLKIPLPPKGREAIRRKAEEVGSRINFVSEASTGKFTHNIRMPWTVVDTNADSVNNHSLYWHPPVIKFMLTDYTMTARARKMNVWAVAVSGVVVVLSVGLFFVRRKG